MSVELIKKEMERFLASPEAGVICMKGKWGVGKTYAWNKWLLEARRENKLSLTSYSYVSLFGLDSLDQLKYSIFENSVSAAAIGTKPSVESLKENALAVGEVWARKSLAFISAVPVVKSASAVVQGAAFLSVKNKLICIDDLERKGVHLSAKDVLGLISHLRTEKDCKIVLILNDGALEQSDIDDLDRFREKVIDTTVDFVPTPEECTSVALTDNKPWNDELRKFLRSMSLSNIRVIKKIAQSCDRIGPLLNKFNPKVFDQAVMTCAVAGWSIYVTDESPTFEFLMHKRPLQAAGFEKENVTDQEAVWNTILDEIGFTNMDELDVVLYNGMAQGFLDEMALLEKAQSAHQKFEVGETNEAFDKAWQLFHGSLEDNETEVAEKIFESFRNNLQYVTPMNMNGTVSVLKRLGANEKALEALHAYIKERNESAEFFNVDNDPFLSRESIDEDVMKAFDEKFASLVTEDNGNDPVEILSRIGRSAAWSRADMAVLMRLTVDEFAAVFKRAAGPDLHRIIRASLIFDQTVGMQEQTALVSQTAREALKLLAQSSRINAARLKRYGVNVEEPH